MGIWNRTGTTDSRVGLAIDAVSGSLALVASADTVFTRPSNAVSVHAHARTETPDDLAKTLRDWVRAHGLRQARTVLILPHSEYDLMLIDRPPVAREDLESALRWSLGERLDYPPSEATIAALEQAGDLKSTEPRQVHVASAHIARLRPLVEAVHASGLRLERIGIAELALGAVSQGLQAAEKGYAVLHITDTHAQLCLFQDHDFKLARHFIMPSGAIRKIDLAKTILAEVQRTLDFYDSRHARSAQSMHTLHLIMGSRHAAWLPRVLSVELPLTVTTLEHPAWLHAPQADLQPLALGGLLGDLP